jgi:hypothetical protein
MSLKEKSRNLGAEMNEATVELEKKGILLFKIFN